MVNKEEKIAWRLTRQKTYTRQPVHNKVAKDFGLAKELPKDDNLIKADYGNNDVRKL